MVAVTLLHRQGYFRQHLDALGKQTESPDLWNPEEILEPMAPRVSITLEGREVQVRAWRYLVSGLSGQVPIYFLDTALPENSPWDQTLTDFLYGGDDHYRLCQEVILGFGGVAVLKALGWGGKLIYHLNEGHSALLALSLLERQIEGRGDKIPQEADVEAIRKLCVFTTHTPVPAGQDQFSWEMVLHVLGTERAALLEATQSRFNTSLNMTYLAMGSPCGTAKFPLACSLVIR
jgi:starch phosphorylase